ncbi:NAD(P)H-binding protein [Actinosynnema sp. NPDC020468]|uniref:NAD(P)-dependent oxidoreductase n=1 Tax=Actinosynnema sp. NPDC020468 TaxID=3154488 RepID=UPI0033CA1A0B
MGKLVVFGAGGRAGKLVVAEAQGRGHEVTALSRAEGDVTDLDAVVRLTAGHDAAVLAATPASSPAELAAATWDRRFFVKAADALLASRVPRLVVIGLFANLITPSSGRVRDDPALFPPSLKEFALAHAAGVDRLAAADTEVDWVVLTPPAALAYDGVRTGRYLTGGEVAPAGGLSYSDLAVAVVDEAFAPTRHRVLVSVFSG